MNRGSVRDNADGAERWTGVSRSWDRPARVYMGRRSRRCAWRSIEGSMVVINNYNLEFWHSSSQARASLAAAPSH